MIKIQLTNFQLEKLSSYFLTLSQITAGSLLLKFFEPEAKIELNQKSLITFIGALIIFLSSLITGLFIAGKVYKREE